MRQNRKFICVQAKKKERGIEVTREREKESTEKNCVVKFVTYKFYFPFFACVCVCAVHVSGFCGSHKCSNKRQWAKEGEGGMEGSGVERYAPLVAT